MGAEGAKRATLKDVAREAGVSVGLVSRVLGGYGSYSAETARRVIEAARRLSYQPDMLARSLRLGRSRTIGVVVSYLLSSYWTAFGRDIDAEAARHSYQALLGTAATEADAERAYYRTLLEHRVAGIIAAPSPAAEPVVEELVASGLPMVILGNNWPGIGAPRIYFRDRDAGRRATEHLLALGHRRIAFVTGSTVQWGANERLTGYREAMGAAGKGEDDQVVVGGSHLFDVTYEAVDRALASSARPTALLAGNELVASAALQCLKDRRVAIPGEVSFVMFGDPQWAAFYRPGLTTVRLPRSELARLSVETLLAQVEGEGTVPDEQVMDVDLVVRESTAPPA